LNPFEALQMKITKKVTAFQGKYIRVVNKYCLTDTGQEMVWETVERTNVYDRGAVVIIAVTKDKEIIFERNWRAPSETWVVQFPAGLTDIKGEGEKKTARRELLEETGYMADKLIPVIASALSADLTPTVAVHFYAPEVEYVASPKFDLAEKIEVVKVPVDKIPEFLLHLPEGTGLDLRVPGVLWIMEKMKMI
jgi:ADP-ribose pyrophosphatase